MRLIYVFIMLFSTLYTNAQTQDQYRTAARNVEGQRVLGELVRSFMYDGAFPERPQNAYLQFWRINPQTPKQHFDSLTISELKTYHFRESIEGKDVPCSMIIHERIVLKGLQIHHKKYKKDGKVYKKEKYYALGTHERWNCNFEFLDKNDSSKYDLRTIGKRFKRKYEQTEGQMEITKAFFDWLRQVNKNWKVTEKESEDIEDLDSESDLDDLYLWMMLIGA